MKTSAVLLLCAGLSACAVSKETYTPDGKLGHNINCSGVALTWGDCYQKAGDIRGAKGYDVIAGGTDSGTIASPTVATSTINRNLLVKCKE